MGPNNLAMRRRWIEIYGKAWLGLLVFILSIRPPFGQTDERDIHLVLLRQPSVVEKVLSRTPNLALLERRHALQTSEAVAYRDSLERAQLQLIDRLIRRVDSSLPSNASAGRGSIEILDRRHFLLNVLFVRASDSALKRIRAEPAVQTVVRSRERFPLLDTAPRVVNAPSYWAVIPGGTQNAGKGIKIGIIDSGINQTHPMFSGEDLIPPAGFPKGNLSFANNKVIVARSYHQLFPNTQATLTPEDEMGHGSRVAAVAAGRSVDAPLAPVQGIAPMAFLGNYKVFGAPDRNSVTSSAAIIAALSDAVEDGMDIVNMSLGGDAGEPTTDPEQKAVALAVQAGVVVVVAAGNGGPQRGTIKSPGTSPAAITVGAVTNGRVFSPALEISADPPPPDEIATLSYLPGNGVAIPEAIGPLPIVSIKTLDPSETACTPITSGALDGLAVLVRRGGCLFQDKADHLYAAGAEVMIVYNNLDEGAIEMAFDGERGAGGPAVMIDKSGGEELRDFLWDHSEASATLHAEDDLRRFPSKTDRLNGFSSRGPNIDLSIKPDLSAVGSEIYSASKNGSEYTLNSSGTSFSCPMVAGAAALLLQLHPVWSPRAIKSTLVGTTSRRVTWEGKPAGVNLTGSGRLDLEEALKTTVMMDPVSASFGVFDVPISLEIGSERSISLTNLSEDEVVLNLQVIETISNPSVGVTVAPPSLTLSPRGTGHVDLTLFSLPPLTAGTFEGYLRIQDRGSNCRLSLVYWGEISPTDEPDIIQVSRSSPGTFHSFSEALRSAKPGSIIELVDDGTYAGPLHLHSNAQGMRLDGVTIRALAEKYPVIDGTGTAEDSAVVSVRNLKNITIEGLEITGGLRGIEFVDSTGVVRKNRIRGRPQDTTGFGVHLSHSRVHLMENEIFSTGGSAVAAVGSEALLQANIIGGYGPENANSGNGILGTSGARLTVFDNLIQQSENGQGIQVSDATALVKGNVITRSLGKTGDGILARGSLTRLDVRDNLIYENERAGVSLSEGASAFLLRDWVFQNLDSGLLLESRSSLVGEGLKLYQNGLAMKLSDSSGRISSSVLAFSSSDGVLSRMSSLRVSQCTLFGNAAHGVAVSSPVENLISNSIVYENGVGSLLGLKAFEVISNLIGDDQFLGLNHNVSANPRLEEPSQFDFRPLIDSPVIDSGDNSLIAVTADLYSHLRIVDGTGDGVAVTDLGAIEFASEFSVPLRTPIFSVQPDQWVGLAITNAHTVPSMQSAPEGSDSASSRIRLKMRSLAGLELGETEISVPRQSQDSWLLTEQFEKIEDGWIELLPTGPDVVSFALLGNWETTLLDGVPLTPALAKQILFPEIRNGVSEYTTFFLVNPNNETLSVALTWENSDRSDLRVARTIPPEGMLKSTFRELFGSVNGGYVIVESVPPSPFYGLELFGTKDAVGALLGLDIGAGAKQLYAAQLASSEAAETVLNVINSGSEATELTCDALSEQGTLLASVHYTVEAGAQLRKSAKELFGFTLPVVGWVRLQSSSSTVTGSFSFEDPAGMWLAALPLQSEGAREFTLSHVAHTSTIFSGVALLNSSVAEALVNIEVFGPNSELTAASQLRLPPWKKRALLLNEWVSGLEQQSGGFIRIRSTIGIIGFELFGSYDLDYMAAVPQQVTVY